MSKILIVDDEPGQRTIIRNILTKSGHIVSDAESVDRALITIDEWMPDVVLTDFKLGARNGLELLETAMKMAAVPEVILMTAYGSIETAVKAMKLGAYDYLTKPIERDELILIVERAAEKHTMKLDGMRVKENARKQLFDGLIAESQPMKDILIAVEKVAPTDATVLIRGESGTGKERIARLIHYLSPRSDRPMQCINCSAFPETLLESELFGYEKGAFTGANSRKVGLIEAASGSTLFLDEVADMSLNTQAKLLRVLQEKEIRRVGSTTTIAVDIRVISATNKNLESCIKNGLFREDLYYRLNIIPLSIPSLRSRKDDIVSLVNYFLKRRGSTQKIGEEAMNRLCEYTWPGNVRELEAVIDRTMILSTNPAIGVNDLPIEVQSGGVRTSQSSQTQFTSLELFDIPAGGIVFEDFERFLLAQALAKTNGLMTDAAKLLGMSYRTFQYRATKFGLLDSSLSE